MTLRDATKRSDAAIRKARRLRQQVDDWEAKRREAFERECELDRADDPEPADPVGDYDEEKALDDRDRARDMNS